jgi:hypothetical protein
MAHVSKFGKRSVFLNLEDGSCYYSCTIARGPKPGMWLLFLNLENVSCFQTWKCLLCLNLEDVSRFVTKKTRISFRYVEASYILKPVKYPG